jgi:hypothetical protein
MALSLDNIVTVSDHLQKEENHIKLVMIGLNNHHFLEI